MNMKFIDFRGELEKRFKCKKGEEFVWIFDESLVEYTEQVVIEHKLHLPKLYRYSPADYNNIRNLETQKIYLSPAGKLNDVFEGLGAPSERKDKGKYESEIEDMAYIKSFSECKNDLLMWGIYADSYAGMCVEYDMSKASDDILYHLFPVIYMKDRHQKGYLERAREEMLELKMAMSRDDKSYITSDTFLVDLVPLYLQKPKGWRKEREWRVVVSAYQLYMSQKDVETSDDDGGCAEKLYNINKQSIDFKYAKTIYLGPRMSEDKIDHLKEIGKSLKVKVYQMELSGTEYKLNPRLLVDNK